MSIEKYYLETFGCQMNVLDSQLIAGQFREMGIQRVDDVADADLILFNTCSVRQHAEDKVLSRLGQLKHLKRRRPDVLLGVLGCMAERMKQELFAQVPHLDLICGPAELPRLPALLADAAVQRPQSALSDEFSRRIDKLDRSAIDHELEQLDVSRAPSPGENVLQSYVRVQRGCDKFCTYCVVPYTRGPERSRPPESILTEARRLAAAGCRELTLLGQTVNSYQYREGSRIVGLAELLERVHTVSDIQRIRFVTSFPTDFDENIFRVMRELPKVCPYLHIPAQSGSDRILKAMKRGYTVDEYLDIIDTARRYVPDITLAGDFIVGFCGETDDDFAATVRLVQRVGYKSLFVFKYSPRPGTTADRAQLDDIPDDVKAARNNELLAVQRDISLHHKQQLVGQTVEVLVEGYSKSALRAQANRPADSDFVDAEQVCGDEVGPDLSRQLVGRTPHDLIAVFDGSADLIGSIVRVRVTSVSPLTLFGEVDGMLLPASRPD